MTKPNTGNLDPGETASHELRSYAVGFVVSAALTIAAFAAVLSDLSTMMKIIIVCVAALLQVSTHLAKFLHLSIHGRQSREDLLLVLFSASLLAIMAGGTVWILSDLRSRMHGPMEEGAMTHPSSDAVPPAAPLTRR
ncbi:cytochrome C oxidase subunit IV family protein [Novosphingopyxis sp. YJ-S2-01]|uniref:cytochrome C oxidase subunit IV family protein n=1 Tax=Novosphingopyxis sp. YJ-S2-01 TaxID=2794021 RepID=UPI0018DC10AC|nr:cytochrome C oxidase subunit IV family protein [Novosphingopyxis sp. YJ-S2-01]MBH9536508.1 cytochrome C oxidase subunit IV family protein [Novosphingopyxis sp. YJ-S2-01]